MLKEIAINGYKSIEEEKLALCPLTILTGLNSAGKSTVIQSILILSSMFSNQFSYSIKQQMKSYSDFNTNRNRYRNSKEIAISAHCCDNSVVEIINDSKAFFKKTDCDSSIYDFEKNLFYISANRIGQEDLAIYNEEMKFGANGEFVFGYFDQKKSETIAQELTIETADSLTLDSQVSYWLNQILEIDMRINTEMVTSSKVKVTYDVDGIEKLSPLNFGAGNSYLAKIVIMGLSCSPGNIFLIENPEIHLHPKAQSKLADFFCFLATKGVQLVIETHSEHILNKLRYCVYKQNLLPHEIIIHYKKSANEKFFTLGINKNGHFVNEKNSEIEFPSGFFDSTLKELLEIM